MAGIRLTPSILADRDQSIRFSPNKIMILLGTSQDSGQSMKPDCPYVRFDSGAKSVCCKTVLNRVCQETLVTWNWFVSIRRSIVSHQAIVSFFEPKPGNGCEIKADSFLDIKGQDENLLLSCYFLDTSVKLIRYFFTHYWRVLGFTPLGSG